MLDKPTSTSPNSSPSTSRPGTKQPYTTGKETRSRHVPCAMSQPHRSTLYGSALGTTTRDMRSCPFRGQNEIKTRWRNHYGRMEGFPRSPKTISKRSCLCRAKDAGKALGLYPSSPGKAWRSPWTPLHPHTTNAHKLGSLPFAYTPSL